MHVNLNSTYSGGGSNNAVSYSLFMQVEMKFLIMVFYIF